MEDVGRVHGFQCPEGLVDEVLAVVVGEVLGADDTVHVSLHQLLEDAGHRLAQALGIGWAWALRRRTWIK